MFTVYFEMCAFCYNKIIYKSQMKMQFEKLLSPFYAVVKI